MFVAKSGAWTNVPRYLVVVGAGLSPRIHFYSPLDRKEEVP